MKKRKNGRIIPIPKVGGVLPLIPILAGISKVGAIAGGAGTIINAIRDIINLRKNNNNGSSGSKKIGEGLFLTPHRKDKKAGPGTHWTCYFKFNNLINYYDSFGNLSPPKEFIKFFENFDIYYNWEQDQEYNTFDQATPTMDRLFTLTSYNSELSQDFFPSIELDEGSTYAL
ncbi:unnamed protein product, partial [Brugia timori]